METHIWIILRWWEMSSSSLWLVVLWIEEWRKSFLEFYQKLEIFLWYNDIFVLIFELTYNPTIRFSAIIVCENSACPNTRPKYCIWCYCNWPYLGTYLKSCKMQFRRIDLVSIGPPSLKLWPNLVFGWFPHCNYNVKLESAGGFLFIGL